MTRKLQSVLANLPPGRRRKIKARADELEQQIEGLHALRRMAALSQVELAERLGVKQPTVHKIERQTDLYLSTLRRFVEAGGGTLELRVELPGRGSFRLDGVGELTTDEAG